MNYNIISYITYIPIAVYITVVVGYKCYKNGLVYVESIFGDKDVAQSVNKILLIGYYLTNIGYAIMVLKDWPELNSVYQMINQVSIKLASIILILAGLHYMNIIGLSLSRKKVTEININQKI